MRLRLAAALWLLPAAPLFAGSDDAPIQRHWADLRLGDRLRAVQSRYPAVRPWPSTREPESGLIRMLVERSAAKGLPSEIESFRLGLRRDRVVLVQVVFTAAQSRKKPLERLVTELSMRYGEPSRRDLIYQWRDDHTVLKAFNEEFPLKDGTLELRTSVEIYDRDERPSRRR